MEEIGYARWPKGWISGFVAQRGLANAFRRGSEIMAEKFITI